MSPTRTTQQSIQQFMRTQAFPKITQTIGDRTFAKLEGDSITFHPPENTLRRLPDGTVDGPPRVLGSQLRDFSDNGIFTKSWYSLYRKTKALVHRHLEQFLGITRPDGFNPHGSPQALLDLNHQDTHKLITQTARHIMSTTGHGYVRNPQALGNNLLGHLVGPDLINQTIALAGSQAVIGDLNATRRNLKALHQAARSNPNAVVLWYRCCTDGPPTHQEGPDPQEILDQTAQAFRRAYQDADEPHPWLSDPEAVDHHRLWQAFSNLNHRAVGAAWRHENTIQQCVIAAHLALHTGAQPSHTALNYLLRNTHPHSHPGTHALLCAFVAESKRRLDHRGTGTQSQLATEIEQMELHIYREGRNQPSATTTFLAAHEHTAPLPWEKVKSLFPEPEPEPQGTASASRRRARRHDATHPATLTREEAARRKQQVSRVVLDIAMSHTPNRPGQQAHVTTTESTVILHPGNQKEAIVTISRRQDNTLELANQSCWSTGTSLPDPTGQADQDLLLPSTMDTALMAGAVLIRDHLRANRSTLPTQRLLPSMPVLMEVLTSNMLILPPETQRRLDDTRLTTQWRQALRSLLDADTWSLAMQMHGQVTVEDYNRTAVIPQAARQLRHANPGALAWLLHHDPPAEHINHPGQAIRLARQSAERHGIPRNLWKTLSRLPPQIVAELPHENHQNTRAILHAISRHGAVPYPTTLHVMKQHILFEEGDEEYWYPQDNSNIIALLDIIFREDARRRTPCAWTPDQLRDVTDYVHAMQTLNQPIRSTTWNGLLQATQDWHHHLNEIMQQQLWQQQLKAQHGYYPAWNSLLAQHRRGPHVVVPLTDALMLHNEGTAMHHCVGAYGQRCAKGESRIFSIREPNGNPLATTEMELSNGRWYPAQTRGPHNHDPGSEAKTTAVQLAEAYSERHQQEPDNTSQHWYVHAETGFIVNAIPEDAEHRPRNDHAL